MMTEAVVTRFKPGERAIVKEAARRLGFSMNGFVRELVLKAAAAVIPFGVVGEQASAEPAAA